MLSDYEGFRGQFLFSTMKSELAFLDVKGHVHLFNSEIQGAILAAFMEREVRPALAREPEFLPRINEPRDLYPHKAAPAAVRGLVPIEAYVASIERLARAFQRPAA
jgi:hypothetical protein